ncbi:MAG: DUF401 family protein [Candidatus Bathyarchaeia archaeon]
MLIGWFGFFSAVAVLLFLSRRNLGVAMFVGAVILGVFLCPGNLPFIVWSSLVDPSTFLLAAIVGLIPVIGGVLNETGQMDRLVRNLRVGRRFFLMVSPALIGLLPMPGGALLSAPLVDKAGVGLSSERKAGVNVWFRHVLYLVYPLSADLIVSTASAGIGLYQPIPYLFVFLLLSLFLGFFSLLRGDYGGINYEEAFSLRDLLLPLLVLLVAPILDFVLGGLLVLPIREVATFIGVLASLFLAVVFGRPSLAGFRRIVVRAKPWDFAFMMAGIMVFLGVFKGSGVLDLFMSVPLSPIVLFGVAFMLGFVTGRIVTPAGIVFPIYIMKFGSISPMVFSLIYFGIFLGYVSTPVHPCVSLTLASLKVDLKDYFRTVGLPVCVAGFVSLLAMLLLTM